MEIEHLKKDTCVNNNIINAMINCEFFSSYDE